MQMVFILYFQKEIYCLSLKFPVLTTSKELENRLYQISLTFNFSAKRVTP